MIDNLKLFEDEIAKFRSDLNGNILVGIPNNGRLCEDVWNLLESKCNINRGNPRSLFHQSGDIMYISARSSDLPHLLDANLLDVIITGRDYVKEACISAYEVADLHLQKCEIAVLSHLSNPTKTSKVRVASQYPNLARDYYESNGIDIILLEISGAAEMYLKAGIVNEAIDAVMTGATAEANQIQVLKVIDQTSGRIYIRTKESLTAGIQHFINQILHIQVTP